MRTGMYTRAGIVAAALVALPAVGYAQQVPAEVATHCALKAANQWDARIQYWRDKGSASQVARTERNKERVAEACLNEFKRQQAKVTKTEQAQAKADQINAKVSKIENFDVAGVKLEMTRPQAEQALLATGYVLDKAAPCNKAPKAGCISAQRGKNENVGVFLAGTDLANGGYVFEVKYTYLHHPAGGRPSGGVPSLPQDFLRDAVEQIASKYGEPISRETETCGNPSVDMPTLYYAAKGIARVEDGAVTTSKPDIMEGALMAFVGSQDYQWPGNCLMAIGILLQRNRIVEREAIRQRDARSAAAAKSPAPQAKF